MGIQQPPIVWGDPSESYRWAVASAKKGRKKKRKRGHDSRKTLDSPQIHIFLGTRKRLIPSKSILARLVGRKQVVEEFNAHEIILIVLRALSHAKFKNVIDIEVDGRTIYSEPDMRKDIHKVIQSIEDDGSFKESMSATIEAAIQGKKSLHARVEVRRTHKLGSPPIDVIFEGVVEERQFRTLRNYLSDHLDISDDADE